VTPAARAESKDEQQIRALEDKFIAAVNAKDLDAIMKMYVPGNELFVFDISPPRQYVGFDAYRKDWKAFLDMAKGLFMPRSATSASHGWHARLQPQHAAFVRHQRRWLAVGIQCARHDCYRKVDGKWL